MEVKTGYKQTDVGVIPNDWSAKTIATLCRLVNGRGFKPHEWSVDGLPIIRIQNLNGSDEFNFYSGQYDPKITVESGQLLFAWSGSRGTSFGPHVWKGETALLNYHTWKMVINPREVRHDYFLYALKHLTAVIEKNAHGASALVHTQKWVMEKYNVAVPDSQDEQQAIANALSDVDELIASLDALIAKKRDLKQAAMQQLLIGKIRLKGFEDEWPLAKVADFAVVDPDTLGSGTDPNYRFNYISLEDVDSGKLTGFAEVDFRSAPSRARRRIATGDILLATVRPNLKSHLLFNKTTAHWIASTGFAIIRCMPSRSLPEFLFQHLFGETISSQINTLISGSNYPAISSNDVRALQILLPTIHEQTAISEVLSDMDAELTELELRRDKTIALKQGMMQELLTGRMRLI